MGEKRYPVTVQGRQRAFRDGKSYRSRLLSDFVTTLSILVFLLLILPFAWVRFGLLLSYVQMEGLPEAISLVGPIGWRCLLMMVAPLGVSAVCTLLFNLLIPRRAFKLKGLSFDFFRLSPTHYWKNLRENFPVNLALIIILSLLLFQPIYNLLLSTDNFLLSLSLTSALQVLSELQFKLLCIFSFWISFAVIDFFWRARIFKQDLRMSIDELKQELKESEISPELKALVRSQMQHQIYHDLHEKISRAGTLIVGRR